MLQITWISIDDANDKWEAEKIKRYEEMFKSLEERELKKREKKEKRKEKDEEKEWLKFD